MLGFKAGAVVSVEETAEAFERVFGANGKFGGATDELAKTFEGTLSMIGDKFFNFKRAILEAGFFPELKKQFGDLDIFLKANQKTLDDIAVSIGEGLAQAVKFSGDAIVFLKDNFDLLVTTIKFLIALKIVGIFMSLSAAIGVANGSMLLFNATIKRNLFIAGAAIVISQFDKIQTALGKLKGDFDNVTEAIEQNTLLIKHYENELAIAQGALTMFSNQAGISADQLKVYSDIVDETTKKLEALRKTNSSLKSLETDHMRTQTIPIISSKEKETEDFSLRNLVDQLRKEQDIIDKHNDEIQKILNQNKLDSIQVFHDFEQEKERINNEAKVKEINDEVAHFKRLKEVHEQYGNSRLEGEKLFEDKKSELKTQAVKESLTSARGALEALSGINENAFKAFKAVQIAEATINAYKAASNAFKTYPFPFNIAAAGAALVQGMAMVAQIRSINYSKREQGGAVIAGKSYMVGEGGAEMFTPSTNGNIESNNSKPITVNFNINTVDASGFNQLLVNSRGVIINMINSAVNEKGRAAII